MVSASVQHFVVAGGVAANQVLRFELTKLCTKNNLQFIAPPINLCTDNAAMIAWAGLERFLKGYRSDLDVSPLPRWPL
jgi:N6-L-threonylcarbamoyladenine synthase